MTRIGVLGANGQVGAEVCLLLAAQPGVEVIPISRNPTGSAYLRSRGLPCRHGRAANAQEAPGLLADCDLVLNFARPAVGRPSDMRAANQSLISNMAAYSRPGARLVYFSSLCAYRRFRPMSEPASVTAYGWEKRSVERIVRSEARRQGKPAWILRLGHVAGELQGISSEIRHLIRRGPVVVPWAGAHASNVVYTATIVESALAIAAGREAPGTYDLVCTPAWTWRMVLEYEASVVDATLRMEEPVPALPPGGGAGRFPARWISGARAMAAGALGSPRVRELGLIALNFLSAETNLRTQSAHFQRRARAEIGQLSHRPSSTGAFLYAAAGSRYLRSLRPTEVLLADRVFRLNEAGDGTGFVPNRPPAL